MSSKFDAMQCALDLLLGHIESDDDTAVEVIAVLKEITGDLHDHSHQANDAPNPTAAFLTSELWKILDHEGVARSLTKQHFTAFY